MGRHGQRLVDHGIGTAYLARLVAEDVDANPETAFLCGLLHDIGKMVILKRHDTTRSGRTSRAAAGRARRAARALASA